MSSSAEHLKIEPALATAVRFTSDRLHVALNDGREISVPLDRYARLQRASASERGHWEIAAFGTAVRWPDIDEDVSVADLLGVPESMVEEAAGFTQTEIR